MCKSTPNHGENNQKKCSVDGCLGELHGRTYCRLHHKKMWRISKGMKPRLPANTQCSVARCGQVQKVQGVCGKHYMEKWHAENPRAKKTYEPMSVTHPELSKELYGVDPAKTIRWTRRILHWVCKKHGHIYPSKGEHRIRGIGCGICSNRICLKGFNDMATTHKKLAKGLVGDPIKVVAGTGKILDWKCEKGHIFPARGADRVKQDSGCTFCNNQSVLVGFNDMQSTHRELASQLVGTDPTTIVAGTGERLKWKCENGHTWWATGASRVSGTGCKDCAKTGFKPERPSFFYLIQKPDIFKLGIGSHGSGRLNRHMSKGWEIIETIDMSGYAADALEDACIAAFSSKGIPIGQFRKTFDGYTESWYKHDLEVRTIRQLCRRLGVKLDHYLAS